MYLNEAKPVDKLTHRSRFGQNEGSSRADISYAKKL